MSALSDHSGRSRIGSGKFGISRLVVEARSGNVFSSVRHIGLFRTLSAALERQFELNAAWVVDKQLPQRRAGHDEFAPVEPGRLDPRNIGTIARAGGRAVIDCC